MIPKEIRTTVVLLCAFVLFCFVCAAWLIVHGRGKASRSAAETQVSNSRTVSAKEASGVHSDVEGQTETIRQTVESATNEVRQAPDPAARNAAALRGLCRTNPNASPDCRLLDSGS